MTRVLIIDDHPIVLQGCRRVLADEGVCEVMDARNIVQGYRLYRRHHPEVIILDLTLHGGDLSGLSFLRRLRTHDARTAILVFSMHGDAIVVKGALEAGANGYLLKDTTSEEFLTAFRKVRVGLPYLSHDLASKVAFFGSGGKNNPLGAMTAREMQTLALLAEGKPYASVAAELNVSYKTVVNTASQLKAKLGVNTLPELIRIAVRHLAIS